MIIIIAYADKTGLPNGWCQEICISQSHHTNPKVTKGLFEVSKNKHDLFVKRHTQKSFHAD